MNILEEKTEQTVRWHFSGVGCIGPSNCEGCPHKRERLYVCLGSRCNLNMKEDVK